MHIREPGPVNVGELRKFQDRWDLQEDGVFGNQTMGNVLAVEEQLNQMEDWHAQRTIDLEKMTARYEQAKAEARFYRSKSDNLVQHMRDQKPWWKFW